MKDRLVVFTKNNARILTNFPLPRNVNKRAKFLINPEIDHLTKVPTHFWKYDCGVIKEMSRPEKIYRMRHIKLFGIDNDWKKVLYGPKRNYWKYLPIVSIIVLSVLITHILTRLIING